MKKYFSVELKINSDQLIQKIELLLEFKVSVLDQIVDKFISEAFIFTLNSAVNDRNIFTRQFIPTVSAGVPNKLVCILDLDIVYFIRKWLIAIRAGDNNFNAIRHSDSFNCRGN